MLRRPVPCHNRRRARCRMNRRVPCQVRGFILRRRIAPNRLGMWIGMGTIIMDRRKRRRCQCLIPNRTTRHNNRICRRRRPNGATLVLRRRTERRRPPWTRVWRRSGIGKSVGGRDWRGYRRTIPIRSAIGFRFSPYLRVSARHHDRPRSGGGRLWCFMALMQR